MENNQHMFSDEERQRERDNFHYLTIVSRPSEVDEKESET
jgi:hypothetical protein